VVGGEVNLTKKGITQKIVFFSFHFFLFLLEAISTNVFQKKFQCGHKIQMCGLDVGKDGISICSKMSLEW
jgi:hypothetical protein